MITAKKTIRDADGNVLESGLTRSTAGIAKKGEKGRIEFWVEEKAENTYAFNFGDYGNYGKPRWGAEVLRSGAELDAIIEQLMDLRSGKSKSTRVPFVDPTPEETATTATAEEVTESPATTPTAETAAATPATATS